MDNDLISREALKKALKSNCDVCNDKNTNWCEHCCPLNDFEDLIDNAPAVETMNPDYQIKVNIPEEETQKLIEELQRCKPCILPESEFTDDDIQELIKENFNIGYEMAKNKYARPQGEWEPNSFQFECNLCENLNAYKSNFCPNCGADMRGAE